MLVPLAIFGMPERIELLGELYTELSGRLGAPLARRRPITLYTRPGGEGIGVHDETGLREHTRTLSARDAAAAWAAIGPL